MSRNIINRDGDLITERTNVKGSEVLVVHDIGGEGQRDGDLIEKKKRIANKYGKNPHRRGLPVIMTGDKQKREEW